MMNCYDKKGKPIGLLEWGRLLKNKEYKIVKQEHANKYFVSTVWLGMDHSLLDGPPLTFETMVFHMNDGVTDWSDVAMDRYSTEEEALAGHAKMVERVTNGEFDKEEV